MNFIISFTQDPSASVEEKLRTLRDSVQMALNTITNADGSVNTGEISWANLKGRPNLSVVATTGDYEDLRNKPILEQVAYSGSYNDLFDTPTDLVIVEPVVSQEIVVDPGMIMTEGIELPVVEGYTPMAVAGWNITGADVLVRSMMIYDGFLEVIANNTDELNQATLSIAANILYYKTT